MKYASLLLTLLWSASALAQSPWCGIWVCHKFTSNTRDEAWDIARTAEAWIFLELDRGQDMMLGPYVFEQLYPINPNYPKTLHTFNLPQVDLISLWARIDLPSLGRTGEWYAMTGAFSMPGPVEVKASLLLLSNSWIGESWAPWRWSVEFYPFLSYRFVPEPSVLSLLLPLTLFPIRRRKSWPK